MKIKLLFPIVLLTSFFAFVACEKESLETDTRDKLIGNWNVVESEAGNPLPIAVRQMNDAYIVSISKSAVYQSDVQIKNFFQLGQDFEVTAEIDQDNIQITQTTINDVTVKGSGTISKNKKQIEWSYWVDMGDGEEIEYKATYTK